MTQRQVVWRIDAAVAAGTALVTGLDVWWSAPGTREADILSYGLLVIAVLAVLLRHRGPLAATLVCAAVLTAWTVLGHRGELLNLPTMVALFTVATDGARRRTVWVGVAAVAWSAGLGWFVDGWSTAPMSELVWPAAALLLGEAVRSGRELRREYAEREAHAAHAREREARDRVRHERLRIAHEVHDVVAHTMAAVNVQMSVAVAAFDQQPAAARQALVQARTASRDAMTELRAALALLRDDASDGPAARAPSAPPPRLDQLGDLLDPARAAGVDITLAGEVTGEEMPAVVEVAAYRIVQEALTNVVRHARASTATVTVIEDGTTVTVDVRDDGIGAQTRASLGGHGLAGMAERAAALGGRVEAGPLAGGGFRVHAVLPLRGGA